jgi:hypothetical protein
MIKDAPENKATTQGLSHYVEVIVNNFDQLSEEDSARLRNLLLDEDEEVRNQAQYLLQEEIDSEGFEDYGPNFSMERELNEQLKLIRKMRMSVRYAGVEVDMKERKEVISACNSFFSSLMKYHEKVVNLERLRLVEQALVKSVKQFSEQSEDREQVYRDFIDILKSNLEGIK